MPGDACAKSMNFTKRNRRDVDIMIRIAKVMMEKKSKKLMSRAICPFCMGKKTRRAVMCRSCQTENKRAIAEEDGVRKSDGRCKDCGERVGPRAKRCKSCAGYHRVAKRRGEI